MGRIKIGTRITSAIANVHTNFGVYTYMHFVFELRRTYKTSNAAYRTAA